MDTLTIILLLIIAVLVVALTLAIVTRPKVDTLSDDLSDDTSNRIGVLKLQNELAPYVRREKGKVIIKVVKP